MKTSNKFAKLLLLGSLVNCIIYLLGESLGSVAVGIACLLGAVFLSFDKE